RSDVSCSQLQVGAEQHCCSCIGIGQVRQVAADCFDACVKLLRLCLLDIVREDPNTCIRNAQVFSVRQFIANERNVCQRDTQMYVESKSEERRSCLSLGKEDGFAVVFGYRSEKEFRLAKIVSERSFGQSEFQ